MAKKGVHTDAVKTFYYVHTRFWELMAGAVLAYFHSVGRWPAQMTCWAHAAIFNRLIFRHVPPVERQGAMFVNLLAFVGLSLIVLAAFKLKAQQPYPGARALVPVAGTLLLILAGREAWINRRILAHRWIVGIGLISYPLYLWHWPILSYLRIMESATPSRAWRIGAVAVSFLLAWLTWRFIERPMRYGTNYRRTKTALLIVLACLIAVSVSSPISATGWRFASRKP